MFIPNVTKDATGLYTCIATNSIGSSRANIRLETTYGMLLTQKSYQNHNFVIFIFFNVKGHLCSGTVIGVR